MSVPGEPAGHRDYEDMAVAHVLGGLDEERGRVFRAHLLECSHCRARVGELRAIASDLAGVERSARREQQAEAGAVVDTKEDTEEPAPPPPSRSPWPLWAALVGLLVAVIGLSVYVFLLRSDVVNLEQQLADRTAATAVFEHGEEMPITYEAVGVSAAVRAEGREIAVVIDGLADGGSYRVELKDDAAAAPRTVPATVDDGRLFMLVEQRPGDERLAVRRGDGERVMEAELTARGN